MLSIPPIPISCQILAAAVVVTAAVYDVRFRRIPNWLTVSGFVAGFALNVVLFGLEGFVVSGAGALLAMMLYLVLYMLRAIGAGDVKLMAAVGAIVGATAWIGICLASAIAGGILAVGLLVKRGRLFETLFNVQLIVAELAHFRAPHRSYSAIDVRNTQALRMPHGISIAVGTVLYLCLLHRVPDVALFGLAS